MPVKMPLGPLMIDVEGLQLTHDDKKRLHHPLVGSVILFAKNYHDKAQLDYLCEDIKSLRSPELVIAVDQEGGRLQTLANDFFTLPCLHSFAQVFDRSPSRAEQLLRAHALVMATEIQSVGIDLSFTPVVDLMMPESQIIGDRAFHHEPVIVAKMAQMYAKALNDFGCIAVAKHFPGHGSVVEDSHATLPVDKRSLTEIMAADLLPYQLLAQHDLDAVMTAHVHFPNVDKYLPSFSSYWLKTILQEKLEFNGIVFCENLTMDGALTNLENIPHSLAGRVEHALNSGCDIAIAGGDLSAIDELLMADKSQLFINQQHQGGERLSRQVQRRVETSLLSNSQTYDEAKELLLKIN